MNRKYIYFIAASTLVCFLLIIMFFAGNRPDQQVSADVSQESPSFLTYISGSGIVEPASGNIVITSPFNRLVEKINVTVNEQVKKGDVLFELYNQDLKANLRAKQKKYDESLSYLNKLKSFPQREDLIIAQENLNRSYVALELARAEYCLSNRCAKCPDQRYINSLKYRQAQSDYLVARAQFDKVRCGTWQPDLKIAEDMMEQARAEMEAMESQVERTYVKSPVDGTVLQIKVHAGESFDQNKTAVIIGNIKSLNLRVGIDQFNELRFRPDCPAVAFRQGDDKTEIPLELIHIEPYMVPKRYLTNELSERVDTQIFEILYRIGENNSHLLIGEHLDVYIYVGDCSGQASTDPEQKSDLIDDQ